MFWQRSFFLTLTVYKHGEQWDMLARLFNLKGPNFWAIDYEVHKYNVTLLYKGLMEDIAERCNMDYLISRGNTFKYFAYAH